MFECQQFWYVVYTRPRWEKKIARVLDEKGINHYCPLNRVYRQWSDRRKVVLEPLFKGYVFVSLPEEQKWDILKIDGIINFVHWLGVPAKVRQQEIDTIKKFLYEFKNVEVSDIQLNEKDTVKIIKGVMADYKGIIIEIIGNKARVKIDSMGISLSAIFDKKSLVQS